MAVSLLSTSSQAIPLKCKSVMSGVCWLLITLTTNSSLDHGPAGFHHSSDPSPTALYSIIPLRNTILLALPKEGKHMLATGPLHLLFSLSECSSTYIPMAPSLTSSRSLLKSHLFREAFLTPPNREYHLVTFYPLIPLFFHHMYHYLAFYDTFIGLFVNSLSPLLECTL